MTSFITVRDNKNGELVHINPAAIVSIQIVPNGDRAVVHLTQGDTLHVVDNDVHGMMDDLAAWKEHQMANRSLQPGTQALIPPR